MVFSKKDGMDYLYFDQFSHSAKQELEEQRAEADRLCVAESMHLAEKSQMAQAMFTTKKNEEPHLQWFLNKSDQKEKGVGHYKC